MIACTQLFSEYVCGCVWFLFSSYLDFLHTVILLSLARLYSVVKYSLIISYYLHCWRCEASTSYRELHKVSLSFGLQRMKSMHAKLNAAAVVESSSQLFAGLYCYWDSFNGALLQIFFCFALCATNPLFCWICCHGMLVCATQLVNGLCPDNLFVVSILSSGSPCADG